jgi:hypothetical protein
MIYGTAVTVNRAAITFGPSPPATALTPEPERW